jgi:hypothetical protein
MIAPIKKPEALEASPGIRDARRLVASALLTERPHPPDAAPPVPAWRAWLFTAWVVVVAAAYFLCIAGLV